MHSTRQRRNTMSIVNDNSNTKHLKHFKEIVEMIKHPGGDIFADAGLINMNTTKTQEKASREEWKNHKRHL